VTKRGSIVWQGMGNPIPILNVHSGKL